MFLIRLFTALVTLMTAPLALAVELPVAICDPAQFGCGGAPKNMIYQLIVGDGSTGGIALLMLEIAAGLSVVMIIGGGIQMITSLGDESKITQYKWAMAYAMIGLCVSILAQFVISAVGTQDYGQFSGGQNLHLSVLRQAAWILRAVLNALFIMMLVLAALKMLYAQGKADDFNSAKKMLYWGLAGAVIVNLAAALASAVTQFFVV